MKSINITAKQVKQTSKEICLGNGYRHSFESIRMAKKFLADTNRFLTECLVIVNLSYTEAFAQYRAIWFAGGSNRKGRQEYLTQQSRIKTMLQATDDMLEKFNHSHYGSNDCYFAFIDMKKACLFLQEALAIMEVINRKRNFTPAMYACIVLKKRCALVTDKINKYPELLT